MPAAKKKVAGRIEPKVVAEPDWNSYEAIKIDPKFSKIGFILDGQKFRCLPEPPPIVYAGMKDGMWPQSEVVMFIQGCLNDVPPRPGAPSDVERFNEIIARKNPVVPIHTLAAILQDLVVKYSGGFPTETSDSSSDGQQDVNDGSMGSSSSEV